VNPSQGGRIAVAVFGSDDFDVEEVEFSTLNFGPAGASFEHRSGPHIRDVDGDGIADLLLHFRTEEVGFEFGDLEACVRGETFDGFAFEGCDAIRIVPAADEGGGEG
jgi:hypothetical protein